MQELTLNTTVEEANLIVKALQELPHKMVHELVVKLSVQAEEQLKPKSKEEKKD